MTQPRRKELTPARRRALEKQIADRVNDDQDEPPVGVPESPDPPTTRCPKCETGSLFMVCGTPNCTFSEPLASQPVLAHRCHDGKLYAYPTVVCSRCRTGTGVNLVAALRARPVEPPPITTETRTLPSGRQFIRHRCACGSRWDTPLPGESPFLDPESEWHKPGCVYGVEPPPPSEPTVADVLDWLKKRPGCSWQATIIDIEKVLAELRAGPPDRREPT